MIEITINGESRALAQPVTLAEVLELYEIPARIVVVERNREIAPRDQLDQILVMDGDQLEIVQMMAGG